MIDLTCSPEVIGIIAYADTTGIPYKVTSTFRPGAITAAGNSSRHGRKLAVDFAAPRPSLDSEDLARIFRAFTPIEKHLNELIYAGPQVSYNIKAGKRVGKYAQAIHHNHVHVAVDPGVILAVLTPHPTTPAEVHVEAAPADTDGREEMAEPVDALAAPNGGVWVLTRDGGIRAYHGAPFYNSYPGLPEKDRQGERTFVEIRPNDRGGYTLISSGNEPYDFGP